MNHSSKAHEACFIELLNTHITDYVTLVRQRATNRVLSSEALISHLHTVLPDKFDAESWELIDTIVYDFVGGMLLLQKSTGKTIRQFIEIWNAHSLEYPTRSPEEWLHRYVLAAKLHGVAEVDLHSIVGLIAKELYPNDGLSRCVMAYLVLNPTPECAHFLFPQICRDLTTQHYQELYRGVESFLSLPKGTLVVRD